MLTYICVTLIELQSISDKFNRPKPISQSITVLQYYTDYKLSVAFHLIFRFSVASGVRFFCIITLLYYHSSALSLFCIITLLHYHSSALSLFCIITLLHCHSSALSLFCIITLLYYHSSALSLFCIITLLHYHSSALSLLYYHSSHLFPTSLRVYFSEIQSHRKRWTRFETART